MPRMVLLYSAVKCLAWYYYSLQLDASHGSLPLDGVINEVRMVYMCNTVLINVLTRYYILHASTVRLVPFFYESYKSVEVPALLCIAIFRVPYLKKEKMEHKISLASDTAVFLENMT